MGKLWATTWSIRGKVKCFENVMKIISALLPFMRGGGFPSQRASNAELCLFLVVKLNNLLNNLSICWWFETFQSSCCITLIWWGCVVSYVCMYYINHWYHTTVHLYICIISKRTIPDSKVHWASMGPTWGWHDPGGPHVGPMNLASWDGMWHFSYRLWNTVYPIKYAHSFVVLCFAWIKYLKQRTLTTMVDIQQVKMQIYIMHIYVVVISYFPVDSCDVFIHIFFRFA